MIHIHRLNLDQLAQKHFTDFFRRKYLPNLISFWESEINPQREKFIRYLLKHIKTIVIGKPEELAWILEGIIKDSDLVVVMDELSATVVTNEARKVINTRIKSYDKTKVPTDAEVFAAKIEKVFSYSDFCIYKPVGKWCAYELLRELKLKSCPYCNRLPLTTYEANDESGKKLRPDLDHFYAISIFPFFGVSFYNLIPSCSDCNERLKHVEIFDHSTHLNPYFGGFNDDIRFHVEFEEGSSETDYIGQFFGNQGEFELEFKKLSKDSYFLQQAQGNMKTFHLLRIYNQEHKQDVEIIIRRKQMYHPSVYQMYEKDFPTLDKEQLALIHRITVQGHSLELQDLDKKCLSKLTRDVAIQFGML